MAVRPPEADVSAIVEALAVLRRGAGTPSYAEIARGVGAIRQVRVPPDARPARTTVYDCFRPDRQRLDPDLVCDIAQYLGVGEPALSGWREAVGRATSKEPHRWPDVVPLAAPGPDLVGRAAEAARARALLAQHGVVVLTGMAGIGKSALAEWVAGELLAGGEVTAAWRVGLHGASATPAAAARAVDALQQRLRLRSREELVEHFTHHATLLVVEDAVGAEDVASLRRLAPVRLLVTSRRMLEGLPRVEVAPLSPSASVDMLAALAPGLGTRAARAVADVCLGLPLALELAARRLVDKQHWPLADQLASLGGGVLGGGALADQLHGVLASGYHGLSEDLRRALLDLAVHPPGLIGQQAVDTLLGSRSSDVRRLAHHCLLVPSRRGGWWMHDLVREFALRQSALEGRSSRQARLRERLTDLKLGELVQVAAALAPAFVPSWNWLAEPPEGLPTAEATPWLDENLSTTLALVDAAEKAGDDQRGWRLSLVLSSLFATLLDPRVGLRLARVARNAAERLGGLREAATAERHLANLLYRCDRFEEADIGFERALLVALRTGDPFMVAGARNGLASCASARGRHDDAIAQFDEVVTLLDAIGDHLRAAVTHANASVVMGRAGRHEQALQRAREVVSTARRNDWPAVELMGLRAAFPSALVIANPHRLAALWQREQELAEQFQDLPGLTYAALHEAQAGLVLGRLAAAQAACARAQALGEQSGSAVIRCDAALVAGDVALAAQDTALARTRYEWALELATTVDEHAATVEARGRLRHLDQTAQAAPADAAPDVETLDP